MITGRLSIEIEAGTETPGGWLKTDMITDHLLLGRDMLITEIGITMEIIRDPLTEVHQDTGRQGDLLKRNRHAENWKEDEALLRHEDAYHPLLVTMITPQGKTDTEMAGINLPQEDGHHLLQQSLRDRPHPHVDVRGEGVPQERKFHLQDRE